MKFAHLTFTVILCVPLLSAVVAKSEPAYQSMLHPKTRYSQKFNSVSSTAKPDYEMRKTHQHYQKFGHSSMPQEHYQSTLPAITQHLQPVQDSLVPQHAHLHPQAQQQLIQLIQRALFTTQQQNVPTAMIIITQPAYVPANVPNALPSNDNIIYGTTAANTNPAQQQLLSYFHNNPQARYQFLHGNQQPTYQQQFVPQTSGASSMGNFQIVSSPIQYQSSYLPAALQTTHMSPATTLYQQQQPQPQAQPLIQQQQSPLHLNQLSELAQAAADQYGLPVQLEPSAALAEGREASAPVRSLPPIITGFENFSPEQQAKIKAQLSQHFGAPLQPLSVGKSSGNKESDSKNSGQHYVVNPKYQTLSTRLKNEEFMPSPQVKRSNDGIRSQRANFAKRIEM